MFVDAFPPLLLIRPSFDWSIVSTPNQAGPPVTTCRSTTVDLGVGLLRTTILGRCLVGITTATPIPLIPSDGTFVFPHLMGIRVPPFWATTNLFTDTGDIPNSVTHPILFPVFCGVDLPRPPGWFGFHYDCLRYSIRPIHSRTVLRCAPAICR